MRERERGKKFFASWRFCLLARSDLRNDLMGKDFSSLKWAISELCDVNNNWTGMSAPHRSALIGAASTKEERERESSSNFPGGYIFA